MHVDRKESTNNAKLLLQLGDPPGWPVTCSDLAPLAVAGSTASIADGNGGVDLVQDFARRELSEWPFHRFPPAFTLGLGHASSGPSGAAFKKPGSRVLPPTWSSCLHCSPGSLKLEWFSDQRGHHTQRLSCPVWRKKWNVDRWNSWSASAVQTSPRSDSKELH